MVPSYAALASHQTPCTVSSTGDAGVGEAGGRCSGGGGESAQAGEWLYSHKRVDGVQETMCMVFGHKPWCEVGAWRARGFLSQALLLQSTHADCRTDWVVMSYSDATQLAADNEALTTVRGHQITKLQHGHTEGSRTPIIKSSSRLPYTQALQSNR
jgi:hypothetical protein